MRLANTAQVEPNYVEYEPLWTAILNPFFLSKLKDTLPKEEKLALRRIVFDEFISAIIKMLQRLTLTTYAPVIVEGEGGAKVIMPQAPTANPTGSSRTYTDEEKVDTELRLAEGAVEGGAPEEIEKTLQPRVPKDFELFLCLVQFCLRVLPGKSKKPKGGAHLQLLSGWIYNLGRELITRSNMYPLVSGFYRLFGLLMSLSEKLDYFANVSVRFPPPSPS